MDGSVRLTGESSLRGRLEICKGSIWGSVCTSRGFSKHDANVACRMLGQQPLGKIEVIIMIMSTYNYYYETIGSTLFTTNTSNKNAPMYADFDCSPMDATFVECGNPSGLETGIASCGLGIVGLQCVGKSNVYI